MPLQETSGAASYDAFGGGPPFEPVYIESVFSTWLYTGNGSTQTITNGIDLSGKGGLVWTKPRTNPSGLNGGLWDTARGVLKVLSTEGSFSESTVANSLTTFASNGFTLGTGFNQNDSGTTYASWTFRKQAKFFDVVTYTGNGTAGRTVAHSLGSVPGCIIIKRTDSGEEWVIYHRSLGTGKYLRFTTSPEFAVSMVSATSATNFTLTSNPYVNDPTGTYVAYIFAHNAGGFGLTGTDNVISCGSYTGTNAAGNAQTLGYEPQWLLIKSASGVGDWFLLDNMRGIPTGGNDACLLANSSIAEFTNANRVDLTATGFQFGGSDLNNSGTTYIYIAIRRGPMKTPTTGTSVFNPVARTGTGTNPTVVTTNNNPDLLMSFPRTASPAAYGMCFWDKLRGISPMLQSASTSAETNTNTTRVLQGWLNTGYQAGADFIEGYLNYSGSTYVNYPITRAPGFFDVVCYTGNNVYQQAQSHNLGVIPELIIVKQRNATRNWAVGCNFTNSEFQYLNLNSGADGGNTNAYTTGGFFGGKPTATTFILAQNAITNASGGAYVAYLFATLAGVSKVGTYTGTGTTLQIDCGFTGGARFVLIKRLGTNTDAGTGDWYVWDSARGIVSGNDPYLLLNSTAAEVTSTDYIDTYSAGFEISSTAPAAINANGGSFIFLAIA